MPVWSERERESERPTQYGNASGRIHAECVAVAVAVMPFELSFTLSVAVCTLLHRMKKEPPLSLFLSRSHSDLEFVGRRCSFVIPLIPFYLYKRIQTTDISPSNAFIAPYV